MAQLDGVFKKNEKDILTAMTLAVKDLRGGFEKKPVEEIYAHMEVVYKAHKAHLMKGNVKPLVECADMLAQQHTTHQFRLHELMRAVLCFKAVVYPYLCQEAEKMSVQCMESYRAVEESCDRLVVNLAQAFLHYGKDHIMNAPLEFPVWVDPSSPGRQTSA